MICDIKMEYAGMLEQMPTTNEYAIDFCRIGSYCMRIFKVRGSNAFNLTCSKLASNYEIDFINRRDNIFRDIVGRKCGISPVA